MGFMKSFLANQGTRQQSLELRLVDVEELISTAVREVEPSALMKQTTILREKGSEGWRALADGNAARQILENLLENGVKFCPKGSEVKIFSRITEGNLIEVTVADNGPGFTGADRERIFQRYSRLSARPSGGEPSTGLGLYIVKSLTEEMSGSIRLMETEKGATFVLTFKAQKLA